MSLSKLLGGIALGFTLTACESSSDETSSSPAEPHEPAARGSDASASAERVDAATSPSPEPASPDPIASEPTTPSSSEAPTTPAPPATASDAGADAGAEPCPPSFLRLNGEVDGRVVSVDTLALNYGGNSALDGFEWELRIRPLGDDLNGTLLLWGDDSFDPELAPDEAVQEEGQTVTFGSGVLLPPGGYDQTVYCIGNGSTATRVGDQLELDFRGVAALGSCPGTPVSGEFYGCSGTRSYQCPSIDTTGSYLSGEVEGLQFPDDTLFAASTVVSDTHLFATFNYGSIQWLQDPETGAISSGLVITAPGTDFGGAVYCIGEGSQFVAEGANATAYTFTNLTRLGSCAEVMGSGSLSGCNR